MAGTLNKVMLIGNLGADPESRKLSSGDPVVNFRVATSDQWRDKQTGERRERTEWHHVVVFNEHLAKIATQYLRKGSKVFIEGKLQTRKYTDQGGVDRYFTEVVLQRYNGELGLLDGKSGEENDTLPERETRANAYAEAKGKSPDQYRGDRHQDFLEDDIPF